MTVNVINAHHQYGIDCLETDKIEKYHRVYMLWALQYLRSLKHLTKPMPTMADFGFNEDSVAYLPDEGFEPIKVPGAGNWK